MQLTPFYKRLQNIYPYRFSPILIIKFCLFVLLFLGCIGCRTYYIPLQSFREQFKGFDSTNLRIVNVLNSKGNVYKYIANPIDDIRCVNIFNRPVTIKNSPSIEIRLKRKNDKKVVLFFDSVILKDSLITGKSSRALGSSQYIPIKQVRRIKIHNKDKNDHYVTRISNKIVIGKPLGITFKREGRRLSTEQLLDITKNNPEAFKDMKISRSLYDASILSGITGGFLIAYALITDINTKNSVVGVGIGLIGLTIPLSIEHLHFTRKAVTTY